MSIEKDNKILHFLRSERFSNYFPFILVALASCMMLTNLGNHYLWQDEAQTALISKTILVHGIPLGTDGKNFFSQEFGAEYGNGYVYRWHTWLPFYIVAGFFWLFGESNFIARLPFAFMGIAIVVLQYYYGNFLWKNRRRAFLGAFLLLFTVPFLLLTRECRYYAPLILLTQASIFSYTLFVQNRRYASALFVVSSVLLFHVQYLYCAVVLMAAGIHLVVFHRDRFIKFSILCSVVVAINVPWIIWLSTIPYSSRYSNQFYTFSETILVAQKYARQFFHYVLGFSFTVFTFLVIYLYALKQKKIELPSGYRLQAYILIILFSVLLFIILIFTAPTQFFRYLGPIIPLACLLVVPLIVKSWNIHHFFGVISFLAFFIGKPLPSFFYELTHDYDGPIEGIVKYLNTHGNFTDTVAITYEDMPVKLYTGMRVVGGLTGEHLSQIKHAKWIIIRKHTIFEQEKVIRQYIRDSVDLSLYKAIVIDYPDIPFENREEPTEHLFKTASHQTNDERVHILQRL
ncbi:MAG: glycosyltransferase family 39 protein [Bacteroidota bacterium]|nr:glycosyltransferase family 39 protein [Bacteroidota bacterium]